MKPRVTFDEEVGYSYLYLGEASTGVVRTSVPLKREEGAPDTLSSRVLDFDAEGRLFGIQTADAERVLRPDLMDESPTDPLIAGAVVARFIPSQAPVRQAGAAGVSLSAGGSGGVGRG